MVDLSLPLVVIGVEVVAFWSCVCTTAIVVGLGSIISLLWALPGVMPFSSTGITGDARIECCIFGPVVESTVVLLWCYSCWSG